MPRNPEPPDYDLEYDAVMEQAALRLRDDPDRGCLAFKAAVAAAYAREKARGRPGTAAVWYKLMELLVDLERSRGYPPWMANRIALAVRVVDELRLAGQTLRQAIRRVLPELKMIPGADAKRVENWRKELHKADGRNMPKQVLLRYRAPLPPGSGNRPEERASFLLEQLRRGIHARRPKGMEP
jgi:hypothetical protein